MVFVQISRLIHIELRTEYTVKKYIKLKIELLKSGSTAKFTA